METVSSNSKFDKLLKQAVDQSLNEAKTEKKKKKKKGESGSHVLESLRKGEGLKKDEDETIKANIFDPDKNKYEKSNKKKQKIREEQQNELEIVDETKPKGKKKKKPKADSEKIEDAIEMSQMSPKDKTMTIDELDTSVVTKPKKKKKKPVEDQTSPRADSDDDILTTPTKKKSKKLEEAETALVEDTVLTPTKKKKKKKVAGTETEDESLLSPAEDLPSPKGKKKKKKDADDEGALSPSEDPVSPKGSKGKKKGKKKDTNAEDEAVLSQDEPSTSKGKKKKKKTDAETEDEVLSPDEDKDLTQKKKGKKKKKKGEAETDEEVLSPGEGEEATAETKGKKKKKTKKKDGEEGTEEGKTDEEGDAPKPKPRKKKKKGAEEIEAEDEPQGLDAEDEGTILAVTVHRTDKLKNDFFIMHPMIRTHVLDEITGKYLPKQHKDRAVTAFYETQNENVKHVLPIMTKPFDFKQNKSVLPVWEELLIFNENFNYFIQDRPKVIIIFELLDFVSMGRTAQDDEHNKGWHRIAWAFLKVVGNNKKMNTGHKVRLQLFEVPSGIRKKAGIEEVYQWWKEGSRKTYPSTLYVTLKGIRPPQEVEPAERSLFATQAERGRITYEELKKSSNWGKKEHKQRTLSSWSRLAGQMCRLPNTLSLALPSAKKGCYIVRFSHDGRSLACACNSMDGHPILVYEIPSGALRGKFAGHFGIIYDLSWSKMDTHLLSSSSDGTVRIWDLQEFSEQQQKLLPHPAFVYCGQFHPRVDNVCATGCYDQVIRIWDVGADGPKAELKQELEDHVGYVNAICFSEDGQKMYSADSVGVIIIWNSFFTEVPSRRGVARDWTIYQRIEDGEMKGTIINHIHLHPRERRLLVHCRDNIIRMFDLRIQRVVQKYIGALNFREQIRSSLTPCGSFVFSGSEDNYAYAWNTDTGDQVIMYSELKYQNPVTDVHYHPRDHMIAFCSLGENSPILVYSYNAQTAQYDAGLSPRVISPAEPDPGETFGTQALADELASRGVMTKDEFNIHSTQRYDKVMRTLNKVTAQMSMTPTLDLPGMTPGSPRMGSPTMMMLSPSQYDAYTPRSSMGPPSMLSPHAPRSMSAIKQQQAFSSQNMYLKASDTWRPTFSEMGQQGRSLSPTLGRAPQLNMTATQSGKAQFNFQAPPGKAINKMDKVVAMYDYKAQRSDELNLFAGDIVTVLYKDTENWWMGELPNGQQGFFPSNYVTQEDELMDTHRTGMTTPDDSDTDTKNVTAVRSKTGELKFISGNEDSEDDLLESKRERRRRKRNSQDSTLQSDASQTSTNGKPPRKTKQKVRINETTESNA